MLCNLFTLVAVVAISVDYPPVLAQTPDKEAPVAIDLKMGARTVRFEHRKHIKSLDNVCVYCHLTAKGKIDGGYGEDTARILCIPCHDEEPDLETDCKDCHNISAKGAQRK